MYDPYDPEEIRRRQLFDMETDAADQVVMAPDEEELPASQTEQSVPTVGNNRTVPEMTGAQRQYSQTMSQMPTPDQYQPSKKRTVLNAILGGLAGASGGAKVGYEVGSKLRTAPYDTAMSSWQQAMGRGEAGVKLDNTIQAQDINRQRATNYGVNAQARAKTATANEEYKRKLGDNLPWVAKTKEDALDFAHAKQRPAAPVRPTAFDQYKDDPEAYGKFQQGQHPLNPNAETPAERLAWRNRQEAGRNQRNANNIAARPQPAPAIPAQQQGAENMAVQQLLRTNPEFAEFVVPGDGKKVLARVKTADEIPKAGGGLLGMGGISPQQEILAREKYRQFLTHLDKKKKEILGSKGGGSAWEGGIVQ